MSDRNQARGVLLMLKGVLSEMPAEQQAKVEDIKTRLKALLDEGGEEALFAYSILGQEIALEQPD